MGFASRSTTDLIQIIANGGGVIMEAGSKSQADLVQIAANTAQRGGSVTMVGMDARSTQDLVQIAANGKGRVTFA